MMEWYYRTQCILGGTQDAEGQGPYATTILQVLLLPKSHMTFVISSYEPVQSTFLIFCSLLLPASVYAGLLLSNSLSLRGYNNKYPRPPDVRPWSGGT